MNGPNAVIRDLQYVFAQFPLASLLHLRASRHRLVRSHYHTTSGGCLMYLLSEPLPVSQRIDSKEALTRFFARRDKVANYILAEDPHYQPAKWLVRLWDGQICADVRARYGDCRYLSEELVMQVLDEAIAERRATVEQNGENLSSPRLTACGLAFAANSQHSS